MERLNVYCQNFSVEELYGLPCLDEYELAGYEIDMQDRSNLIPEVPAVFIIRNPLNGTDLWNYVRKVRERKMNAAFLLLIVRKDFALLYGACQNGVTAVQLEPASKSEIETQLVRCLRRVEEVTQSWKDRTLLEDYEYEKQHRIMERLLSNILEKPQEVEMLLPEINRRYGTKLGAYGYQVFSVNVDRYELCTKTSHFLKEVTLLALHAMAQAEEIIMGYMPPYGLIGIIYYGKDIPLEKRKQEYLRLWEEIMKLQEFYGSFRATIGVGMLAETLGQASDSLIQAAFAQEYRMTRTEQVLMKEELPEVRPLTDYVPERMLKELIRYTALGEEEHVKGWFREFHEHIEPKFMEYPPAFAKFCWEVYQAGEQFRKGERMRFREQKFQMLQHIFDGMERNRELEEIMLQVCRFRQQETGEELDVVSQAISYMKEHYAEPINLDYLAELCGLSNSYFSRKFKEQTGEKYIDVLTDIRVREAQRMLAETEMSVLEIVEETGYCDEKHFRRVFRKITGMNPQEYRKQIRNKI